MKFSGTLQPLLPLIGDELGIALADMLAEAMAAFEFFLGQIDIVKARIVEGRHGDPNAFAFSSGSNPLPADRRARRRARLIGVESGLVDPLAQPEEFDGHMKGRETPEQIEGVGCGV